MKIAIVGAGIGGLTAYHSLKKHLPDSTITVYESYPSPKSTTSVIGGGLGLAPNGLRAIASVSPRAAEYIQARGLRCHHMTFRNSKGTLLGRYINGREVRYGYGLVMAPRAMVHEAVMLDLPEGAVQWGRKVSTVRELEDGSGVEILFQDGAKLVVDLVIGADGVRSVVREAAFGKEYQAEYNGLTGIGGFLPSTSISAQFLDSLKNDPVTMTFGPDGFFGYSLAGPLKPDLSQDQKEPQIMWWSTYQVSPPPPRDTPLATLHDQLMTRHAPWVSPNDTPDTKVFSSVISHACGAGPDSAPASAADRNLLILPCYVTPRLRSWCTPSGRIVLLGDAAHAMPPDSGQGVSCASEDGLAIALLLEHYSSQEPTDVGVVLKKAAKAYEAVRMRRVENIVDVAKKRGDAKKPKTWWQEWLRDWILWLVCQLPESRNDGLYAYDVPNEVAKYTAKNVL